MICTNLLSHYWDGSRNGCHTPNLFDKIISSKCKNVTYTAKVPITKAEYIANKEDSTYHVSGIQLYYEDGSCLKNNYYRTVEGTQVVCAATYRRQTKEAFSFK